VRVKAQNWVRLLCVRQRPEGFSRRSFHLEVASGLPLSMSEVEMIRMSLVLSTLLLVTSISASGGEPIQVAVSPSISFAPSNLRIRVRVTPNPENRALTVVAESGDFYRSSQIQLEGDHAPATTMIEFRGLPGGDYEIVAALVDSVGRQRAVGRQSVSVIPAAGGH
jgi:hypothetical protein